MTLSTVVSLALALAASAASLGGIDVGSVFVQTSPVDIDIPDPPGPLVSASFDGCGNSLDGWTDESGNVWTSHSGEWRCQGNDVARANRRVDLGHTTVDIDPYTTDLRVSTSMHDISHQNNRSGPGLVLLADDSGNFLYVMYERDEEQLTVGVTGQPPLAVVSSIGDFETGSFVATLVGNEVTIDFNGIPLGPFDLSGTGLLGNTRFGLLADNDNHSRFDTFTVELLP